MGNKQPISIRQSILVPTLVIVSLSLIIVTSLMFFGFQNSTTEIVESSSKEINKQIILNFENYLNSVIDTADYIQEKTIEYGLRDDNDSLFDIYAQAADVQPDIESIVLIDIAGNQIITSTFKDISEDDITQKEWYIDAITDSSIYHFSSPHPQDIFTVSRTEVITVTKMVDYYISGEEYRGILVVDINISNIITLTETTNLGEDGHIVILNDDDSLIYSNNDECDTDQCTSVQIARDIIFGGKSVDINDTSFYANVNTLRNTRWRMATFINTDILESSRIQAILIMGSVLIGTLLVSIVVSSLISRRISSPISKLKNHMAKIEQGDFYQKIEIDGQREVIALTHSFNVMIEDIRRLMDKVVEEQKSKRRTEFQALQNQINPHFLYNTLDSIVYLSENEMNDKVIKMVIALSRFFRISISRGKAIILLKEELEHAKNYLLIQQIRYNDKFSYEFIVDDSVLDYHVVKLSLQPLIENAIVHGVNTEYSEGHVIIRAFKKEQSLILEVEDDGFGITNEQIQEIFDNINGEVKNKSIGLKNVYQRLKIYYGDEADFEIESELDEKTIVRLIIPIKGAL